MYYYDKIMVLNNLNLPNDFGKKWVISEMNKKYKVISFDLFQALVDVNQKTYEIWDRIMPKKCTNEQAAFYAKELFLNYASIMDVEMQKREFVSMKSIFMKCAQSMINRINLSISPSDLTDSLIIAHREAPLYDDVVETFEYLKDKYQIIIASDADIIMDNHNIKDLGISKKYFSENLQTYKNNIHKNFFDPVLCDLKINSDEIVHIGDSKSDARAANASKIDFIQLNRNQSSFYKCEISSLREFIDIL